MTLEIRGGVVAHSHREPRAKDWACPAPGCEQVAHTETAPRCTQHEISMREKKA